MDICLALFFADPSGDLVRNSFAWSKYILGNPKNADVLDGSNFRDSSPGNRHPKWFVRLVALSQAGRDTPHAAASKRWAICGGRTYAENPGSLLSSSNGPLVRCAEKSLERYSRNAKSCGCL